MYSTHVLQTVYLAFIVDIMPLQFVGVMRCLVCTNMSVSRPPCAGGLWCYLVQQCRAACSSARDTRRLI